MSNINNLFLEDNNRYFRQLILPNFGYESQIKLKNASVLVIGAGGLGSSALFHLASVGVGHIGIIDNDVVEISNLQRQILHFTDDLKKKKVDSAREKLIKLNPNIKITIYSLFFSMSNADEILEKYDFILDCTDNFESKIVINNACIKNKKPFVHAGILEYQGQIMTVIPRQTACYKCIFTENPPTNNSKAVLGIVPGIIGTLQAGEAIKFILGFDGLLVNTVLVYDFLTLDCRKINFSKNKNCESCS